MLSGMLTLLCFTVIVVFYIVWRRQHVAKARAWALSMLPPKNRLSWRLDGGRTTRYEPHRSAETPSSHSGQELGQTVDSASSTGGRAPADGLPDASAATRRMRGSSISTSGPAATDGLLQALPAVIALSHVDPLVLGAIEEASRTSVHGLIPVDKYLHEAFFSKAGASAEGWLHRLEGYVAEQKAATVLRQEGHHVELPDTPNHPGVDLTVDGAPWQIKEGSSAVGHIRQFLAHHSGIEVGTSPEAAAKINDPHVHGIPRLEHDAIATSTRNSIHGIQDGLHPGVHIPYVTLAFSAYREYSLLRDDKTTIEKALGSVGLDVAGAGAGAWAGAKAGALAGALGGPHGAALGALIGSIGGAVGGKMAATHHRLAAFNKAKVEYLKTVDAAHEAITLRIEQSQAELKQLEQDLQARYKDDCALVVRHTQSEIIILQKSLQTRLRMFTEAFPTWLDALANQLKGTA